MDEPTRIAAAIDVGSNTIKMTIARIVDGRVEPVLGNAEVVRLSEGLGQTGYIRQDRIDLAVRVLQGFVTYAIANGAERISAVATEAVRTAHNGQEFLDRVAAGAGLVVRAIDGREEATLTSEGVLAQIDPSGSVLIVDIGGGSTELIATCDGSVIDSISLPVGSGLTTDRYLSGDPPTRDQLALVEQETIACVRDFLAGQSPFDRMILVGGVGQFLLAVLKRSGSVDSSALTGARDFAITMAAAELASVINAPVARARVLPAGFAIARGVNQLAQADRIEVVANGLRIGILRRLAHSHRSEETAR